MTEEQQERFDDCIDRSHELTNWEVLFIDGISDAETLSEWQDGKLNEIWSKLND